MTDVKFPDRLAWSEVIQIDPEVKGKPQADTRQTKRQKNCIKYKVEEDLYIYERNRSAKNI